MMKVVLDTNIVVSGLLISGSPPGRIVDMWVDGVITVVVSPPLLEEYLEVLLRPKFETLGTVGERKAFLEELINQTNTSVVVPEVAFHAVIADPDDNHILDCAVQATADFIVSGDSHLLELKEFKGIAIVSPHEFLKRLS